MDVAASAGVGPRIRRRIPATREGWWFLCATLLVGGAAINSGFSLIFLVWGVMMSLILASGILAEQCLSGLRVTRRLPTGVHAGAPYLMGIVVRNQKRRLPSFSVEIEDVVAGRPIEKRCYFLKVPAGREQQTAYRHVLRRRGVHKLSGVRVSTRFPFGLIRKSHNVDMPAEILVYPALVPVPQSVLPSVPLHRGDENHNQRSRRGEFFGLREFRQGDDPRDIHWRTSARRGRPFVRESEDTRGRTAVVILENAETADAPAQATAGSGDPAPGLADNSFEAAVSMTASLALELVGMGYEVGIGTRGSSIGIGGGRSHAGRLLRFLALVGTAPADVPIDDPHRDAVHVFVRPVAGSSPEVANTNRPLERLT